MTKPNNIDKLKMINDIILTLSLIISVCLVRLLMSIFHANLSPYRNSIFFISTFIAIKILYNVTMRIIRKFIIK